MLDALRQLGPWLLPPKKVRATHKKLEDGMRIKIVVAMVLLLATFLLASDAFQPLNVKPGLWETTITSTANGMPPIPADMQERMAQMTPEQRAKVEAMIKSRYGGTPQTRSYKKCMTKEQVSKDPFSDPEQKCAWTILTSTGSELEANGTSCAAGRNSGVKTDVHVKVLALDSENVKGTGQMTMDGNGQTMNMDFKVTGKWLGASCPIGME
jgi:hypothetical protein